MKLHEKIQYCRKKCGLSQTDLADLLGVSRQSVSKWETAEANPDVTKILQLAKIFGVTTDWLLSEDDATEPKQTEQAATAYPDWLDRLPSFTRKMVKQFGWIYGLRLAIGGVLFMAIGLVARFMFYNTIFDTNMQFDPFAAFNASAWKTASLFTGFIVGLGAVIAIFGVFLAIYLKKHQGNL